MVNSGAPLGQFVVAGGGIPELCLIMWTKICFDGVQLVAKLIKPRVCQLAPFVRTLRHIIVLCDFHLNLVLAPAIGPRLLLVWVLYTIHKISDDGVGSYVRGDDGVSVGATL